MMCSILVDSEVVSPAPHSSKTPLCLHPCGFAQLSSERHFLEACVVLLWRLQEKPLKEPTKLRERWKRWAQVLGMAGTGHASVVFPLL